MEISPWRRRSPLLLGQNGAAKSTLESPVHRRPRDQAGGAISRPPWHEPRCLRLKPLRCSPAAARRRPLGSRRRSRLARQPDDLIVDIAARPDQGAREGIPVTAFERSNVECPFALQSASRGFLQSRLESGKWLGDSSCEFAVFQWRGHISTSCLSRRAQIFTRRIPRVVSHADDGDSPAIRPTDHAHGRRGQVIIYRDPPADGFALRSEISAAEDATASEWTWHADARRAPAC